MNIYGKSGVFVINLTQSGLETKLNQLGLTTDAQKEAWLLNRCKKYWEGIQNWKNPRFEIVNRNFINVNNSTRGKYITPSGTTLDDNEWNIASDFVELINSNSFTLKAHGRDVAGATRICAYDAQKNFTRVLGSTLDINIAFNFTLDESEKYIRFYWRDGAKEANIDFSDYKIQINLSSTSTDYIEHDNSILSAPGEFAMLPNLTADKLYISDGRLYTEKNTAPNTINSNDVTLLETMFSSLDFVEISNVINSGLDTSFPNNKILVPGYAPRTNPIADSTDNLYTVWYNSSGGIRLGFEKGKYANLAEAQSDLDGTEILYQLAQSKITDLTDTESGQAILQAFENGTLYIESRYYETHQASGTTVTLDQELNYIDKISYLDTVNKNRVILSDSDYSFTPGTTSITDLPVADVEYLIESTDVPNIAGNVSFNVPLNYNAVTKSNTSDINALSKQVESLNAVITLLI